MPIEYAVLLAVPVIGALWAGALGLSTALTDLRNRRRTLAHLKSAPKHPGLPAGRHRLSQTGRHHLRPAPAHAL